MAWRFGYCGGIRMWSLGTTLYHSATQLQTLLYFCLYLFHNQLDQRTATWWKRVWQSAIFAQIRKSSFFEFVQLHQIGSTTCMSYSFHHRPTDSQIDEDSSWIAKPNGQRIESGRNRRLFEFEYWSVYRSTKWLVISKLT